MLSRLSNCLILLALACTLQACGGGGGGSAEVVTPPPGDDGRQGGLLKTVSSDEQLLAAVRDGFDTQLSLYLTGVAGGDTAVEAPPADSPEAGSISTTYTLEASVDEQDYVKYDGSHLFIAPSRGLSCCFVFALEPDAALADQALPPEPEPGNRAIRILTTDPESATATETATIPLDDSESVEGLYVDGDRLVAISSSAWWGTYGSEFALPANWTGQQSLVRIYDISNATSPTTAWDLTVEGGFVTSRKIGHTLYLVTRYTPSVDGFNFYPADDAEAQAGEQLLDSLTVDDIIPRKRTGGTESPLFSAGDCYIIDTDSELSAVGGGFPTLTAITAIDLDAPDDLHTTCYAESTSGTYVTTNAIYLTQQDYRDPAAPQTLVHRFAIGEQLEYDGSAAVDGELGTGGNYDFRINEYGNTLRMVTTRWTGDTTDRFEHKLYILRPSESARELEVVATLPNAGRPEAIGKPNENLYGVRFLGDRVYLVTFEQVDPLYVIDVANPADPKIAGTLEITGFSDFLHPVTDQLLLGLGQDAQGLVKLELFNVSDPGMPVSLGAFSLVDGAAWSYSEARYDRHAFTYLADVDGTDRFAVPVNAGFTDPGGAYQQEDRLYLFEIRDKSDPENASMVNVGYLAATPQTENFAGSSLNRSVFHDDAVFYVHGENVWSALWTNPSNQLGPQ